MSENQAPIETIHDQKTVESVKGKRDDTGEKEEAIECIKPERHSLMPRESVEQVIIRSVICQYMFYLA